MTAAIDLAETILQFGAGRFLRAFVDRFVQQANDSGQAVGRVVVVQSTPGSRGDLINAQHGRYHVLVRGCEAGKLVERVDPVHSISRALVANEEWNRVLEVARSPTLRWIVTNATEAGYAVDPADRVDSSPPSSLPGKLVGVLFERFRSGGEPLVLLPCELIQGNATRLREIVHNLAREWSLSAEFVTWVAERCVWLDNLVDCIVTPPPTDHALSETDKLLVSAEPYTLWAVAHPAEGSVPLFEHPAIHLVDDLAPYYLRKVRILNGLHSAMAARFLPEGFQTVLEVMSNDTALRWLKGLLYEEIVPTIAWRVEGVAEFAEQTLDRFRNPFLAHRLRDIALNHAAKVTVRLEPTRDEYERLFGHAPTRLAEVLSSGVSP
jgi:tagaturonate reductase